MSQYLTLTEIDSIANKIRVQIKDQPEIGIILGSGLGGLADSVEHAVRLPYSQFPGWPVSTVIGHVGQLVIGKLEGKNVLIMQGRAHFYEGYSMAQVGLPIRVMQRLGITTLIVTNAAGGVNQNYKPGDLMLIGDHINLLGMVGQNPLMGPNLDELGTRFPDMSCAYDRQLRSIAHQVAKEENILLHEGIYICLSGPSFETPADLRFLRAIGVDAVGMSTVPEVTVARHANQRVLGISGISNKANMGGETVTTHEEVIEAGKIIVPKLTALLQGIIRKI